MKLLIVDDHTDTRGLIKAFIGHLASEVHECDSGDAAMRRCLERLPDLITLDLQMGVVDGLAVLEFVRKICPGVHVVVVTQSEDPQLHALVKQRGAAQSFPKADLTQLRRYVETWHRKAMFPGSSDSNGVPA